MRSGDKTEFINRLKTLDLINRNGRIFSRRDQIQMPMDEVPTDKVASQQQTPAVAEDPLQDMTVTCKQCEVTFVFTKGEQRFFQGEKMTQPARCPECRKWIREKRAETASKNRFQDSPSGPKFKTTIVVWAMCRERDCFYYIIEQTYDVGLHSRRHPMEFDAGTRHFASFNAPSS